MTQAYSFARKLFSATGLELEYMVVDRETLDVRPIVDELMRAATGEYVGDFAPDGAEGVLGWSNELALHVVELKTLEPAATLDGLHLKFQEQIRRIESLLEPMNARLLPSAMHPWMDPHREMRLWPHEFNAVYAGFDRIFSCKGHGWANLQSTHINLPFGDDAEFGRLHAAIRMVLPLIPALAASSPVMEGRATGLADTRLEVYRGNAQRVPSVAGRVVPEPIFTRARYESEILGPIYHDLEPFDAEGILRHEWANARGCIARFERGSIEIRVVDIQESPIADISIAALIVEAVRALASETWMSMEELQAIRVPGLYEVLLDTIRHGERAMISHPRLLCAFGIDGPSIEAGALWRLLIERLLPNHATWTPTLERMVEAGTLSTRIRAALGSRFSAEKLRAVYAELADCLDRGELFHA